MLPSSMSSSAVPHDRPPPFAEVFASFRHRRAVVVSSSGVSLVLDGIAGDARWAGTLVVDLRAGRTRRVVGGDGTALLLDRAWPVDLTPGSVVAWLEEERVPLSHVFNVPLAYRFHTTDTLRQGRGLRFHSSWGFSWLYPSSLPGDPMALYAGTLLAPSGWSEVKIGEEADPTYRDTDNSYVGNFVEVALEEGVVARRIVGYTALTRLLTLESDLPRPLRRGEVFSVVSRMNYKHAPHGAALTAIEQDEGLRFLHDGSASRSYRATTPIAATSHLAGEIMLVLTDIQWNAGEANVGWGVVHKTHTAHFALLLDGTNLVLRVARTGTPDDLLLESGVSIVSLSDRTFFVRYLHEPTADVLVVEAYRVEEDRFVFLGEMRIADYLATGDHRAALSVEETPRPYAYLSAGGPSSPVDVRFVHAMCAEDGSWSGGSRLPTSMATRHEALLRMTDYDSSLRMALLTTGLRENTPFRGVFLSENQTSIERTDPTLSSGVVLQPLAWMRSVICASVRFDLAWLPAKPPTPAHGDHTGMSLFGWFHVGGSRKRVAWVWMSNIGRRGWALEQASGHSLYQTHYDVIDASPARLSLTSYLGDGSVEGACYLTDLDSLDHTEAIAGRTLAEFAISHEGDPAMPGVGLRVDSGEGDLHVGVQATAVTGLVAYRSDVHGDPTALLAQPWVKQGSATLSMTTITQNDPVSRCRLSFASEEGMLWQRRDGAPFASTPLAWADRPGLAVRMIGKVDVVRADTSPLEGSRRPLGAEIIVETAHTRTRLCFAEYDGQHTLFFVHHDDDPDAVFAAALRARRTWATFSKGDTHRVDLVVTSYPHATSAVTLHLFAYVDDRLIAFEDRTFAHTSLPTGTIVGEGVGAKWGVGCTKAATGQIDVVVLETGTSIVQSVAEHASPPPRRWFDLAWRQGVIV